MFFSLVYIRKTMHPIEILKEAANRIKERNFDSPVSIKSSDEFTELGLAFNEMSEGIKQHINALTTINRIGIALSSEKNTAELIKVIMKGAMHLVQADGGILYTVSEHRDAAVSRMHINSMQLEMDEESCSTRFIYDNSGLSLRKELSASSLLSDSIINVPNVYTAQGFNFFSTFYLDKKLGYCSKSSLSVPLKDNENQIIGVLQLLNALDRKTGDIVPFSREDEHIIENLASVTSVALTKTKLLEDFRLLFDSLVELIATAIDEKSSYAGGHSRRVPALSMMIAESACRAPVGVFKDFSLSENELYALKVAALLHDCGKLTVPSHIENKSKKLEIIFDRMHLIDARFEILKRDAFINHLKKGQPNTVVHGDTEWYKIDPAMEEYIKRIESDKSFLHECNQGITPLDDNARLRLFEIAAQYKWRDSEGKQMPVLTENDLHYLSIVQGTITEEERTIINSHVTTTAKLLRSLHYPKQLSEVPEIAEAHHERLNGAGYPKGLKGDQIPLLGRIIAIADIFEALTARDRPYKRRYSLMESLRILGLMKEQGHIDPALFNLFIEDKLYLRYAEKYLSPEQIDDVNFSEIPGYSPELK